MILCQPKMALVGFQGRGCAHVVQPNCCHPFLLEALLFQWPSIRRCASRTMVEHKTPESNKSVIFNALEGTFDENANSRSSEGIPCGSKNCSGFLRSFITSFAKTMRSPSRCSWF